MKTNFKVFYDVLDTKKDSLMYGVVITKKKSFNNFFDAKKFVDKIRIINDPIKLVGMPVIEEI